MMKAVMFVAIATLAAAAAGVQTEPKYKADVPPSISTPSTVQTRIGTLKFTDGLPDEDTVKKVYDNLILLEVWPWAQHEAGHAACL